MEEQAKDRHEYHDGEILAMSGGTYRHSRINTNLLIALGMRLRNNPCEPLDSNMRVRILGRASYVYPGISIVCGGPEFDGDDPKQTTITNPRIVVEVLPDSTERYDRGRKLDLYREVPSLQEYVVVSQQQPLVETFLRQPQGAWLLNPWKEIDAAMRLHSVGMSIPLTEIYSGVKFDDNEQDA